MAVDHAHSHTVEIVPCADDPRCFRWIIRVRGGGVVEHSPYAFVTSNGARISGECWKREHFNEADGDRRLPTSPIRVRRWDAASTVDP